MAKFKHKTHQHVVLMDHEATRPWARFIDGIFDTDDPVHGIKAADVKKITERLKALPEVEEVTPPEGDGEKAADDQSAS